MAPSSPQPDDTGSRLLTVVARTLPEQDRRVLGAAVGALQRLVDDLSADA